MQNKLTCLTVIISLITSGLYFFDGNLEAAIPCVTTAIYALLYASELYRKQLNKREKT